MIEFKGEVSDKIKTQVIKKRDRLIGTCGLIFTILSFICTLIFSIVGWNYIEILIFSYIILLFSIYFLIAPQSGTTMRFRWNWIVTIDDEMIKQELIGSSTQIKIKPLSKIKKVISN